MTELAKITENEVLETAVIVSPNGSPYVSRALTVAETETLNFHLSNARSENTRMAYESQWKGFVKWCFQQGFLPFPATVEVVCLYLSHLNSEGVKRSKIEQSLSAIKAVHHDQDVNSAVTFSHAHVKATLNSIRRTMATDGRSLVKKPRHFSQSEVLKMVRSFGDSPQHVQDKAILLLGVNAGLRASEFCNLQLEDLVFDSLGVDILIRKSKGDQTGLGQRIFVGRLAPHLQELDAVKGLEDWVRHRETFPDDEDSSLFLAFRKGGETCHLNSEGSIHGLTREAVTNLLVRAFDRAGLESGAGASVSSHGFRHTFITTAFSKHVDSARISKTSRHKNLSTLMDYDQTSRRESVVSTSLWS